MNNVVEGQAALDLLVDSVVCAHGTMWDHFEVAAEISDVGSEPDVQETITRLQDAATHLMFAAVVIATGEGKLSHTTYRDEIAAASDAIADLWELSEGAMEVDPH